MEKKAKSSKSSSYGGMMLFFDCLKNLISQKSRETMEKHFKDPQFHSQFQPYMTLRYLSMHSSPQIRKFVCENQFSLERIQDQELFYMFLFDHLPRHASSFIKYIKSLVIQKWR